MPRLSEMSATDPTVVVKLAGEQVPEGSVVVMSPSGLPSPDTEMLWTLEAAYAHARRVQGRTEDPMPA